DSTPALGDVDGDGDLDALVGSADGTLRYFQNTGSATNPVYAEQTGAANPFAGINLGGFSAPPLGDVDGDGDLDAHVGSADGTLHYSHHPGTAISPAYAEQTGAANSCVATILRGFSAPALGDVDGDGDLDLVVGEPLGTLRYFQNTGSATSPTYA